MLDVCWTFIHIIHHATYFSFLNIWNTINSLKCQFMCLLFSYIFSVCSFFFLFLCLPFSSSLVTYLNIFRLSFPLLSSVIKYNIVQFLTYTQVAQHSLLVSTFYYFELNIKILLPYRSFIFLTFKTQMLLYVSPLCTLSTTTENVIVFASSIP